MHQGRGHQNANRCPREIGHDVQELCISPGHTQLTQLEQRTIGREQEHKPDRRETTIVRQAKAERGNAVCGHMFECAWKKPGVRRSSPGTSDAAQIANNEEIAADRLFLSAACFVLS
jgi:hypothetical protein